MNKTYSQLSTVASLKFLWWHRWFCAHRPACMRARACVCAPAQQENVVVKCGAYIDMARRSASLGLQRHRHATAAGRRGIAAYFQERTQPAVLRRMRNELRQTPVEIRRLQQRWNYCSHGARRRCTRDMLGRDARLHHVPFNALQFPSLFLIVVRNVIISSATAAAGDDSASLKSSLWHDNLIVLKMPFIPNRFCWKSSTVSRAAARIFVR